ncbi:hypothetical protein AB9K26_04765 [Psychroserpens sp. XS_ASV72]|uniref:HYC_CC_PP family protein n=1 Tax=Psychroserpens sp. XS_ASV72 TaxID=3241293 RepID=UPI0035182E4C
MLKQITYKMFSAFMAIMVLFLTVSFTVEKHYCGGVLIDSAVFTKAKKCGMEMSTSKASTATMKHCCKDTKEVVKGQDQLKTSKVDNLSFEQQLFVASYFYTYLKPFEQLPKLVIPFKDYKPPNITREIYVLDEVFLI